MAKDVFQDSENIFDDQITGQENLNGDDIEGASDGLETRTLIFLDGQFNGQIDEALVNKVETTNAEEGLKETTEIRLKAASGCGCILRSCLRNLRRIENSLCRLCSSQFWLGEERRNPGDI